MSEGQSQRPVASSVQHR
jgi:hypothetical protein